MIVRISTEGQYELPESAISGLNELDNEAVSVCAQHDDAAFRQTYARLLDYVRSHGESLAGDDLRGSELILPPPDVTLQEAASEFTGEGLIPG